MQVPYPPFPSNFYEFNAKALGDMAILVMPKSFEAVTKMLGLGWQNVISGHENSAWEQTHYMRTGYGTFDNPVTGTWAFEMPAPAAPWAGYAASGRTPRAEIGFTFDEAISFGPSTQNKWPGTVYRSKNSDGTPGDSGSSVLTVPALSPPGTPSGIVAIFVGSLTSFQIQSVGNLFVTKFNNRNYFPGGSALEALWLNARRMHG
jgi:hypothetical protein